MSIVYGYKTSEKEEKEEEKRNKEEIKKGPEHNCFGAFFCACSGYLALVPYLRFGV